MPGPAMVERPAAGVDLDRYDLGLDRWWSEPTYVTEARKKGLVG